MEMHQITDNQVTIPHDLLCPITHDLMEDPVIAADGHTYERAAIQAWLDKGRKTSPYNGAPLEHLNLTANHRIRTIITDFKASRPALERRQQIAADFEEACRLREKEIHEAQVKRNKTEMELLKLSKLLEEEKAKSERLSQQLIEKQQTVPNTNNSDLLSTTSQSRLHFLRKTDIFMTPSQSTQELINLNDIVQSGSLIRADSDASAISRWFNGHYYLFFQTASYYLTLELRKSLCKKHKKKTYRYIFTEDASLACRQCKKENPSKVVERYDRKSIVDFSIQMKPAKIPTDEKELPLHLSQQEIFESRYYPCVVETWNTRKGLTIQKLLAGVEVLTEKNYGFWSFNCRDFAQDLQEFTKSSK